MKIYEIYTGENIGPAPKGVCSKPASQLPASWVSSCKSQGKRQRTGDRKEKVDGKTIKPFEGKGSKAKSMVGLYRTILHNSTFDHTPIASQ